MPTTWRDATKHSLARLLSVRLRAATLLASQGVWVQVAPLLYVGCWVVLYSAAYVDPGVLPRSWQLPPPDQQSPAQRELCETTEDRKFCETCQIFRPPDAHHCGP